MFWSSEGMASYCRWIYLHTLSFSLYSGKRFNDIDSAERCIDGLRKYRNLHPSFSKVILLSSLCANVLKSPMQQLHRIPGTVYAEQSPSLIDQDEDSFKARMEKLKDESSTNLYIEG